MKMKMFRRYATRLGAVALFSAALCTAPMLAQGGGGGRGRMMTPDQQLTMMTEQLSLTADQQKQIKPILEDQQKQMTDLRNSGGDPADMRPKMMAIRTDTETKIKAVLTEDQKTKYDAMLQAQQNRMRGGQNGGGGTPPPPPPQ